MMEFQWQDVWVVLASLVVLWMLIDGGRRVIKHLQQGGTAESMPQEMLSDLLQPLAETWSPERDPIGESVSSARRTRVDPHDEGSIDLAEPIPGFIAFYLMAEKNSVFEGPVLLQSLLSLGLTFGDKQIFHCLDSDTQNPMFSLASAFEPGIFDMDRMGQFKTRGIILFMTLPGPDEPLLTFEHMLETAKKLVLLLNGILCDSDHLILSVDKILEYRGHIQRFERRSKMGLEG